MFAEDRISLRNGDFNVEASSKVLLLRNHIAHILFAEYHSVCPLVGIGTLPLPPPLSPAGVPLPPEPKGEGHSRLRMRGWGNPNSDSDDWRKAKHSAYSVFGMHSAVCAVYKGDI